MKSARSGDRPSAAGNSKAAGTIKAAATATAARKSASAGKTRTAPSRSNSTAPDKTPGKRK
ncbi:MAG: hypothetical protein ABIP08_03180, partial [Lautropia sp.]